MDGKADDQALVGELRRQRGGPCGPGCADTAGTQRGDGSRRSEIRRHFGSLFKVEPCLDDNSDAP
jgi:hypothetical protein